jgi:hypothetical protein
VTEPRLAQRRGGRSGRAGLLDSWPASPVSASTPVPSPVRDHVAASHPLTVGAARPPSRMTTAARASAKREGLWNGDYGCGSRRATWPARVCRPRAAAGNVEARRAAAGSADAGGAETVALGAGDSSSARHRRNADLRTHPLAPDTGHQTWSAAAHPAGSARRQPLGRIFAWTAQGTSAGGRR